MGTSKGYGMPTGGDWTPLKNEATRFVKNVGGSGSGNDSLGSVERLVSRFTSMYSTKRGAGKTGGGISSASARRVGASLGRFLSDVAATGLDEGLRKNGLTDLIGKAAGEVISGILDALVGPASTLDDEAARTALAELESELLEGADTYEDVDESLKQRLEADGVLSIVVKFFAKCIYRQFCVHFYEEWQKKVGAPQATSKLNEVKNYIFLRSENLVNDGSYNKWDGRDGERLSQRILDEIIDIYGVNE
ncbi:MAG: hypothetical protein WBD16_16405 [Pyrinomonadaceae bacterium]